MYSLRELQANFVRGIFSGGNCADLISAQDAKARLAIYRDNVFSNYREALRAVYPVIEKLVGRQFFDHAANRYIAVTHSASGDLHHYGATFADFIRGFPELEPLVYLHDVARLEWMIHESFHAADYPAIALDSLNDISPERFEALNFILHPACRMLASGYPVQHIWRANQPGAAEEMIDLSEGGMNLLVARPQYEVELRELKTGEFVMLAEFAAGRGFGDAYLRTLEADPDFNVAVFMQTHVQARTFVDFSIARGECKVL